MRDYTKINRLEDGKFELCRELVEMVSEADLKEQLMKLEHQKEALIDQISSVDIRINLIKIALEQGKASGDTTMAGIRMSMT